MTSVMSIEIPFQEIDFPFFQGQHHLCEPPEWQNPLINNEFLELARHLRILPSGSGGGSN